MVKNELEEEHLEKVCYGTDEWSETSGICNGCKFKEACGKANPNNKFK